jgi:hypothetical protein
MRTAFQWSDNVLRVYNWETHADCVQVAVYLARVARAWAFVESRSDATSPLLHPAILRIVKVSWTHCMLMDSHESRNADHLIHARQFDQLLPGNHLSVVCHYWVAHMSTPLHGDVGKCLLTFFLKKNQKN